MIKFNINDHIYIKITDAGWKYLRETVGQQYIDSCIDRPPYKYNIDNESWYRLQAHSVFELLPVQGTGVILYSTTILLDEHELHPFNEVFYFNVNKPTNMNLTSKLKLETMKAYKLFGNEKAIITDGKTYSGNEIALEIKNETVFGITILKDLLKLTIDLVSRENLSI